MICLQSRSSRKEPLVPKATDEVIEILGTVGDISNLMTLDTESFVEVSTSPSPASDSGPRPRKRAKLDHLSAEEKAQHRKLMNRISAQSARDRQKALMNTQSKQIDSLTSKNEELQKANRELSEKCENYRLENERLSKLVEEFEAKIRLLEAPTHAVQKEEDMVAEQNSGDVEEANDSSSEPAVPRTIPLPKGPELQTAFSCILLLLSYMQLILIPQNSSQHSKSLANKFSALTMKYPDILSHLKTLRLIMDSPWYQQFQKIRSLNNQMNQNPG